MSKIILLVLALLLVSPFAYRFYQKHQQEAALDNLNDPDRRCIGCDLSGLDLSYRDFRAYDFTNANLTKADLRCSVFSYANLTGAVLSGANITGAVLSGAILGRGTVMERVIWDDGTQCNYNLVR